MPEKCLCGLELHRCTLPKCGKSNQSKQEYDKVYREANKERLKQQRVARKDIKKEQDRQYRQANKEKIKDQKLRFNYGITVEEYDRMYEEHEGLCGVCKEWKPARGRGCLNVHHSHKTGRVIGLLCWECNAALGKFNDDPLLLYRAAYYQELAEEADSLYCVPAASDPDTCGCGRPGTDCSHPDCQNGAYHGGIYKRLKVEEHLIRPVVV